MKSRLLLEMPWNAVCRKWVCGRCLSQYSVLICCFVFRLHLFRPVLWPEQRPHPVVHTHTRTKLFESRSPYFARDMLRHFVYQETNMHFWTLLPLHWADEKDGDGSKTHRKPVHRLLRSQPYRWWVSCLDSHGTEPDGRKRVGTRDRGRSQKTVHPKIGELIATVTEHAGLTFLDLQTSK